MTIKRTSTLSTVTSYPELGISVTNAEQTIEIEYTISRIVDYDGERVTAEYAVSVNGTPSETPFRLNFAYSGATNPIKLAESKLSAYFDKQNAETVSTS